MKNQHLCLSRERYKYLALLRYYYELYWSISTFFELSISSLDLRSSYFEQLSQDDTEF